MTDLSKKRFSRALQYAIEQLDADAMTYCYKNDAEYQQVHKMLVETKNRLIKEYREEEARLAAEFAKERNPNEQSVDEKKDKFDDLIRAAVLRGDSEAELAKILAEYENIDVPALKRDSSGTLICPGHPKLCLGSGDFVPMFERHCDNCGHYLACFPDGKKGLNDEKA